MAVKAQASITISRLVDILSVTRYYLLQSSTSAAPAKPTTNPPSSSWTKTEPSYTSGSTNTLYFVDCTVFTNSTFKYSEVSKSSSYEAAKEAYNKAAAVETRVTKAETAIEQNKTAITLRATKTEVTNYVASRGENLVTNGTALLGDNTNFSGFTYDGSESYYSGGSFKAEGKVTAFTDEFIPVDVSQTYALSYWMKSNSSAASYYDFLNMYDIDKNQILAPNVMYIAGSLTTLSQELKNGDTVVHLQSVAGFSKSETMSGRRGLIFWNYKNSKGYRYGPETYSRYYAVSIWNDASAFDATNNTITLNKAWTKGTFPAGTPVSQSNDGGGFVYFHSNYKFASTNTWTQMTGSLLGVGKNNEPGKFREGTAFVKVGWLLNYNNTDSVTTHISTVSLTQNVGVNDVNAAVADATNALQNEMNTQKNDVIDSCNANITNALDAYVKTGDYEAYKETVTASLELLANQIQIQFETTAESLNSIDGDMQTRFAELSKYIRFSIDGIEIGGSEDSLKLRLDDDLIRFEKNGETLGWWDGIDFHTGNIKIDVTERAQFGNFAFVPRSDGSLMFLKVDNVVGEVHCPDLTDVDIVRASWWEPLPGHGIRVHTTAGTQSIVNPRDITYDATKKYRITYTSKNAKITCYGDYDENMVQSELCTKSTDGVNNITVDGLYEFRFENVDTSITEYSIKDMRIVEVN